MKLPSIISCVVFLGLAGFGWADAPSSQPARDPSNPGRADGIVKEAEDAPATRPTSQPSESAESEQDELVSYQAAATSIQQRLQASLRELQQLRETVAEETIPLSRKLSDLQTELLQARQEHQKTTRKLDSHALDLTQLQKKIKTGEEEATYLSNLLGEYIRNYESTLHIAEKDRWEPTLETAKLAMENSNLSQREVYMAQVALLEESLRRLQDALGGTRFEGTAVSPTGDVKEGTFVMVGPAAIFRSEDGLDVGMVQERLGSLEPSIIPYGLPEDTQAAETMIRESAGLIPLDPTLGNAYKVEETKETLLEHIKKGGEVMWPIFILAGLAFLVAVFKWVSFFFLKTPPQKKIQALLDSIASGDAKTAQNKAMAMKGPIGEMLRTGVDHLREPRELIEEVMYETVLSTRLRLNRLLPLIAITAASAPLLGLLGTVTGIIETFKMITVFGSGDVKTLSGGISVALITTEFGLIVAIPALLMHAFLARKARGMIDQMEKTAVSFVNQVSKSSFSSDEGDAADKPAAPDKPTTADKLEQASRPAKAKENKGPGEAPSGGVGPAPQPA